MRDTIIGVLATALTAAFGWIFHLGTRVTVLETKDEGLTLLINSKFEEVNRRLTSIEGKLE